MMKKVLEVKNLVKEFSKVGKVVDNISFDVGEGEIVGFLGPNGAGKTTTMQMVLGILTPTAGEILMFGKDFIKHKAEIMEQVSFATAYTNFPWVLKVKEVLKYSSYFYGFSNRKARVEEIKKMFKLEEIWESKIAVLSAGQMARVNLAKAFLNKPKILLLDEPTPSLDPVIVKMVHEILLDLQKRENVSVLLTSHNMGEVEDLSDRVIFIDKGKIIANDLPGNLAKKIKDCRVEFILGQSESEEKFVDMVKKSGLEVKKEGNLVVVNIEEQELGDFLRNLYAKGLSFSGISIQKPTLEDYFLKIAHKKFNEMI